MSEKIIKEFTFTAPTADYVTEGSAERQITTEYKGADSIWIYVDVETGKNPQFVSEGDLPDPTDTWRHRSVLLDANNSNHVLLMDLLSGSKGHLNNEEYSEQLNEAGDITEAPDFIFKYSELKEPSAVRYYDLEETHVDNNGIVTYAYQTPVDIESYKSWLQSIIFQKIIDTEEKLKDPVVIETPAAVNRCNRYIAILNYAKDVLLENTQPWKIIVPDLHQV